MAEYELLKEKFKGSYPAGCYANALGADDEKIAEYIIEHTDPYYICDGHGHTDCECDVSLGNDGYSCQVLKVVSIEDLVDTEFIRDGYILVEVDGEFYEVHEPFFHLIYDSNLEEVKEEIRGNFNDFRGFTVVRCPECGSWQVCD